MFTLFFEKQEQEVKSFWARKNKNLNVTGRRTSIYCHEKRNFPSQCSPATAVIPNLKRNNRILKHVSRKIQSTVDHPKDPKKSVGFMHQLGPSQHL